MIKEITNSYLSKIAKIVPNYNKSLEKSIKTNLGVVSISGIAGIVMPGSNVDGFAVYKLKNNQYNIFKMYGNNKGISEIVNYFKEKSDRSHKGMIFQIPFDYTNILNILKSINIFNFKMGINNIVLASYPEVKQNFKNFVSQSNEQF